MSRIRSTNTTIDQKMAGLLNEMNLNFRKYPKMFGNPDFVLTDKGVVIFCDGDFWHGYNFLVKKKRLKRGYWEKKIKKNIDRDKKVNYKLKSEGWTILRFWEHDINKNIRKCEKKILKAVSKL